MRRSARIDANQNAIVAALRDIPGVTVAITSALGSGFPDIVVGFAGRNYLIELKDGSKPPSKRALTDDEYDFFVTWRGQREIACNLDECLEIIGLRGLDS